MSKFSALTIAIAVSALLWAMHIDGKHARAVCEASYSASTCTHILR